MRKTIIINSIILSLFFMVSCGEEELGSEVLVETVSEETDACGWTYSQGYDQGKRIGLDESYFGQWYPRYRSTLEDFAHCNLYVAGVREGYYQYRYGGPKHNQDWNDGPEWPCDPNIQNCPETEGGDPNQ